MPTETITQLIKTNFNLDGVVPSLSWANILLALLVALVCAVAIYFVYRFFYRGTIYNDNFNTLLVMVTLVTAFIIMTVSSNLALSLGMVGALSIVRFRAAIKDPLDVGFIFWAVAAGLTAGAGLYLVALLGTLLIAIIYIGMYWLKRGQQQYLLVCKYNQVIQPEVEKILGQYKTVLKNRTVFNQEVELTLEIKNNQPLAISQQLEMLPKMKTVTVVEFNGDYLG